MYGFVTQNGYVGWLDDRLQLFPTEQEYIEAFISDVEMKEHDGGNE
jgi:hypothetical protein